MTNPNTRIDNISLNLNKQDKITILLVSVALFMDMVDTTSVNVALPTIVSALDVSSIKLKSVATIYFIAISVFIPISLWLADRYGSKFIFTNALILFSLGAFLSGSASNYMALNIGRLIQGIGASMLLTTGRMTILLKFQGSKYIKAMSLASFAVLSGPALGPVLGAFIIYCSSWRFIFFMNIPIGLIAYYYAKQYIPHFTPVNTCKFNITSFILYALTIVCIVYISFDFERTIYLINNEVEYLLVLIMLMTGFIIHQSKTSSPLVDYSLLSNSVFKQAMLGSFLTRMCIGGIPYILTVYLQKYLAFSSFDTGICFAIFSLGMLTARVFSQHLLNKFNLGILLIYNTIFLSLTILMFIMINESTSFLTTWMILFFHGFATSVQFLVIHTLTAKGLREIDLTQGLSVASVIQQFTMGLSVMCVGAVLSFLRKEIISWRYPIEYAFDLTFLSLFGLSVFTCLVLTLFSRSTNRRHLQLLSN